MSKKPWRIIENEHNLARPPWTDAIGIEEIDDAVHVPAIVLWFTRGWEDVHAMASCGAANHSMSMAWTTNCGRLGRSGMVISASWRSGPAPATAVA